MALRIFEGFDAATSSTLSTQLLCKGWASAPGFNFSTTGRFSGKSAGCSTANAVGGRFDIAAVATGVAGVAHGILTGSPTSLPWRILEVTDGTSVQIGVGIDTGLHLFIYRGTTATIIATGTTVLPVNNWTYIELKTTIHNTTGTYELRINGSATPELVATGANTRSTANNQLTGFQLYCSNGASAQAFDDFYMLDTTGAAPYNDFLGEVRVQTLFPSAAGSSTQWTPLSSTNFSNVDDAGLDSDTTYNSSATPGQIDLFATQDLTGSPTIFAGALCYEARKDEAGARTVRSKLKSGATTTNGTTQTLPSSYATYREVYLTDPNTGVAWTASGVNAAEIGYECV